MKHPKIAKKWAAEFPGQKNLPYHKRKGKKKHRPGSLAERRER
jgi:hypothetical protein